MKKRILALLTVLAIVCMVFSAPVAAAGWVEMTPRYYGFTYPGDWSWLKVWGDNWYGLKRCYICVRGESETGYPVSVTYYFGGLSKTVTVNGKSGLCTPYNIEGNPQTYQGAVDIYIARNSGTATLYHPLIMAWEYVY